MARDKTDQSWYLCRVQVAFVLYDKQIAGLDVFYEMDGRKSRCIKEVLDWNREKDARDLGRSELNEFVESMTCFNPLEVKFWKSE